MEIWTKDYALKELAPSTYYRYKRMLEIRITPYFGNYKLNKIKPTDIMRFYDLLAEDTQIVRRKNNNRKKTRKPLRRHYDEEQTKILVNNLQKLKGKQIKYRTAILLDIFTGARLGELVGLTWVDVDFETGKVQINKTTQYAYVEIFEKGPKTANSERITFYGLRHTNVTLTIAKDIQTQIISRKVGHLSVQTTERVYSHFFEYEFKYVPNVMEEFLIVIAN